MNSEAFVQTSPLFAQPSFGSGFARALDLFGAFDAYNASGSDIEADELASASDWAMVGQDLAHAIGQAETVSGQGR